MSAIHAANCNSNLTQNDCNKTSTLKTVQTPLYPIHAKCGVASALLVNQKSCSPIEPLPLADRPQTRR